MWVIKNLSVHLNVGGRLAIEPLNRKSKQQEQKYTQVCMYRTFSKKIPYESDHKTPCIGRLECTSLKKSAALNNENISRFFFQLLDGPLISNLSLSLSPSFQKNLSKMSLKDQEWELVKIPQDESRLKTLNFPERSISLRYRDCLMTSRTIFKNLNHPKNCFFKIPTFFFALPSTLCTYLSAMHVHTSCRHLRLVFGNLSLSLGVK